MKSIVSAKKNRLAVIWATSGAIRKVRWTEENMLRGSMDREEKTDRLRWTAACQTEAENLLRQRFRETVPQILCRSGQKRRRLCRKPHRYSGIPFGQSGLQSQVCFYHFAARQFVNHGHILVNGKKVNIPSYMVKAGDVIEVREKSKQLPIVIAAVESTVRDVPGYIEVDNKKLTAKYTFVPKFDDVPYGAVMEPNLVIEYYSR